jgi:hypothetical protein
MGELVGNLSIFSHFIKHAAKLRSSFIAQIRRMHKLSA